MAETNNSKPLKLIGLILLGMVIVGSGIFGIGKLLESLADPDDEYQGGQYKPKTYTVPLNITDINSTTYNIADYRDRVIVIAFHALSCDYCPENSEGLRDAMKLFTSEELMVFWVSESLLDSYEELQEEADENNFDFIICRDDNYKVGDEFGVNSWPTTVYLAPNGEYTIKNGAQGEYSHRITIESYLE